LGARGARPGKSGIRTECIPELRQIVAIVEPAAAPWREWHHTRAVEPSANEVRLQLDRILASEGFANAERMSKFLRYVVDRTLAGETDQIKEYAIGVDVFGRDGSYDPRLDSIVRVEARRLRSKVDEYYAGHGRNDDIVIRLRRGSYAPSFERRLESAAGPAPIDAPATAIHRERRWRTPVAVALLAVVVVAFAAWRSQFWTSGAAATTIAVLPFNAYSTEPADVLLAARLTDGVTSALARERALRVVAHTRVLQYASASTPIPEIAKALNANVLMEGTVTRRGDSAAVVIRLVGGGYKLWVEEFSGSATDTRDLERRIAAATVPALMKARRPAGR
jgi:TolB-like protein